MRKVVFLILASGLIGAGLWAAFGRLVPLPNSAENDQAASNVPADPWDKVLRSRPADRASKPNADPGVIRLPGEDEHDSRDHFTQQLLRLALDRTVPTYGPYKMVIGESINRLRAFAEVLDGKLDVTWSVSTELRESFLLPIRTEISKGMHGYRLLLIRKGDQERFRHVKTLADLRSFTAGSGHDWQPTEVWKANNLPEITSDSYQSLFTMLAHRRFDYIPRALFEPWLELAEHPQLPLAVEETLLIHYNAANYFFVHPSRADLARRISQGLDMAMADGSYDALLQHFFDFAKLRSHFHMQKRHLLELKNPFFTGQPNPAKLHFWFSPMELLEQFP